jgi:peptidoglycan L-alanyl-D-glutamate endopeptidase CwlK
MPNFGKRSLECLSQCHPDLQRIAILAIERYDFSVIQGYRNEADQNKAFREGKSKAKFGSSPHNFIPALAFDAVPYPIDWNDIKRFERMGEIIMGCAQQLNIRLTWGKSFKGLVDYPHFELANWRELAIRK